MHVWKMISCKFYTILLFFQDIDECSDGSPCAHNCTNTNSGFECDCAVGYKLQNDGVSCEGL